MKIHQTLHGYQQGHTLIAGSVDLSVADKKKMAVLSDWSEYSRGDGSDSSYITAYPLPDCNYYVVAKTWYADEMKRPGCVWTHSLLINTAEIDTTFDFRSLWSYFKRPLSDKERNDLYDFAIEIPDEFDDGIVHSLPIHIPSLAYWLSEMLVNNGRLVFTSSSSASDNQFLLLSILSHLPVGIIKQKSFCSGTARLRQYDSDPFDWQITSAARKKYPSLNQSSNNESAYSSCYEQIATSVLEGGREIPVLVTKFSDDIGDDVHKYEAVLDVYHNLDKLESLTTGKESLFDDTIKRMAEAFPTPGEGVSFKASMLSPNVTKYFCDEQIFIVKMAMTTFHKSYNYQDFDFWNRVSSYSHNHKLAESVVIADYLLTYGKNTLIQNKTLQRLERTFDIKEQKYILENHWPFFQYIAKNNVHVLENDYWTNVEIDKFKELLSVFLNVNHSCDNDIWNAVFSRLINSEIQISFDNLNKFNCHIDVVGLTMEKVNSGVYVASFYLDYCKLNPENMLRWLSGKDTIEQGALVIVCNTIKPDSELARNALSHEWRALLSDQSKVNTLDFALYLFILAYNLRNRADAFKFYKKAFYPIYKAAEADHIDDNEWRQIAVYCPKPAWGWEWDRCAMMRRGFVNWVMDENISNGEIKQFTPERKLNKKLLRMVNKRKDGKGWLPWG